MKTYKTKEAVDRNGKTTVPKKAKVLKVPLQIGGYQEYRMYNTRLGWRLVWGGGTESEPMFEYQNNFKTELEAELYARLECARNDVQELADQVESEE